MGASPGGRDFSSDEKHCNKARATGRWTGQTREMIMVGHSLHGLASDAVASGRH